MADALGVIERPGGTVTAAFVAALRDRTALLVVDNCEHVIEAAAAVVTTIVAAYPDVQALATWERLGIDSEHVLAVPPLAPRPGGGAVRPRVATAAPTSDVTAGPAVVDRICRRLNGVPPRRRWCGAHRPDRDRRRARHGRHRGTRRRDRRCGHAIRAERK